MTQEELLEKYLEDELSPEEQNLFDAEVASDPGFAQQVRLHGRLNMALGNQKEIKLEQSLRGIMDKDDLGSASRKTGRPLTFYLSIAAGFLLLATVGYFLFSGQPTNSELYKKFYFPYDASNELRSGQEVPKNLLDKAFDTYNEGQFDVAHTSFLTILKKFPKNSRARFFLGICQLELGKASKAIKSFQTVIADGNNLYLSQATWYKALGCLQLKDLDCSRQELTGIASQPGRYRESAGKLLEYLKE